MKKKRTILKYKTFDNLYLSSEIFNVLKKFREKNKFQYISICLIILI